MTIHSAAALVEYAAVVAKREAVAQREIADRERAVALHLEDARKTAAADRERIAAGSLDRDIAILKEDLARRQRDCRAGGQRERDRVRSARRVRVKRRLPQRAGPAVAGVDVHEIGRARRHRREREVDRGSEHGNLEVRAGRAAVRSGRRIPLCYGHGALPG